MNYIDYYRNVIDDLKFHPFTKDDIKKDIVEFPDAINHEIKRCFEQNAPIHIVVKLIQLTSDVIAEEYGEDYCIKSYQNIIKKYGLK